ncbi:class I SAM-dependent methyltransferase [Patescibacteria group bacterium]|nr:class I SAM-dependent methyltransferase [Patescibacteria group bacterium]
MNRQTQKELLKIVEKNYIEIAKEFNETRKKELWSELKKISEQIKKGSKILDVGCGNGRIIDALLDKDIKYLGIDSSTNLIELAKSNHKEQGWAQFELGKIEELGKIKEHNFDYVFCLAVIHHIPGTQLQIEALKQLKNKVKKDGRIIISAWNLWNKPKFRSLIIKFALLKLIGKNKMDFGDILFDWKNKKGEKVSKRYYHAFTKRELKRIVKKSGLKIEKIYKDTYNYYLILKWS